MDEKKYYEILWKQCYAAAMRHGCDVASFYSFGSTRLNVRNLKYQQLFDLRIEEFS
jgi:hypothetical protein